MTERRNPAFKLGLFQQERSGLEDKLGGLPFGFPIDRWPNCKVCGLPLNYIAQFHSSEKINLGQEGRALFLFQCLDGAMCEDWDAESGANAALLIEASDLTGRVTQIPEVCQPEPEAIIVRWDTEPTQAEPSSDFAIGGSPSFVRDVPEALIPSARFLLQLSGEIPFQGPAPTAAETGAEHLYYSGGYYGMDQVRKEEPPTERKHYGSGWSRGQSNPPGRPSQIIVRENGTWSMEWANFGGGLAYVHIDDSANRAIMFWVN